MDRTHSVLQLVVVLALLLVGIVVWQADQHARAADDRLICLQRAQATATIALLTPSKVVDKKGRLQAIQLLGRRVDAC